MFLLPIKIVVVFNACHFFVRPLFVSILFGEGKIANSIR